MARSSFFEDTAVVEGLQKQFPSYKENFRYGPQQTSAMHQFAVWTMLEDAGFGASLQHYNPLIDEAVAKQWHINPNWKLIAEMPFGTSTQEPGEKQFAPLEERIFSIQIIIIMYMEYDIAMHRRWTAGYTAAERLRRMD